jgi:hypothetical protein
VVDYRLKFDMPKKNRSSLSLSGKQRMSGPAENATKYSGPLKVHNDRRDTVVMTVGGAQPVPFDSDSGGAVVGSILLNSSDVVNNPDYQAASALYEEYRVLGIRGEYYPKWKHAVPTTAAGALTQIQPGPLLMGPWREDPPTVTSIDEEMIRGNARAVCINESLRLENKADEVDQMEYTNVGSAVPAHGQYGIVLSVSGSNLPSTTVNIGTLFAYYTVQFRTRRSNPIFMRSVETSKEVKEGYVRVEAPEALPQQVVAPARAVVQPPVAHLATPVNVPSAGFFARR